MDGKFIVFSVGILVLCLLIGDKRSEGSLATINGVLVNLVDNCTLHDDSTCADGFCCTKKHLDYPPGAIGQLPKYQLECKPYRRSGEFCYFSTPENFCPCVTKCHTNGFYGACL